MMKNKNTSTSSWDGLNCICLNFTVNRPFSKVSISLFCPITIKISFSYIMSSALGAMMKCPSLYADDIAAEVGAYVDIPRLLLSSF